jgi:ribosomal protein L16 Arg81 hydroxylase
MTESIKRDIIKIKQHVGVTVPEWKRRADELELLLAEMDRLRKAIEKERANYTPEQRTQAFIEDQQRDEQFIKDHYAEFCGDWKKEEEAKTSHFR